MDSVILFVIVLSIAPGGLASICESAKVDVQVGNNRKAKLSGIDSEQAFLDVKKKNFFFLLMCSSCHGNTKAHSPYTNARCYQFLNERPKLVKESFSSLYLQNDTTF